MSRPTSILITGAGGEIGHSLIHRLSETSKLNIITLDMRPLPPELMSKVQDHFIGDILDSQLLQRMVAHYEVEQLFHLAALLSSRSEFSPTLAHRVNVEGTLNLLEFAQIQGESHGKPVMFFFPSSIAAYGLTVAEKDQTRRVKEDEFNSPMTMYGANKLYCEHLGRYYSRHYKQLAAETLYGKVDFRCLRFPGLISADTTPSGGTSDYAPEMIHAAANREAYRCFVRADTKIPFLVMPDAIEAILQLVQAPQKQLTRSVYNIGSFAPTAGEVEAVVRKAFPQAEISYKLDAKRQRIVDSWPGNVDDDAARHDWHYAPKYDFDTAFGEYLIPRIRQRYS